MRKNNKLINVKVITVIAAIAFILTGFRSDDQRGFKKMDKVSSSAKVNASGKNGDSYRMFINNLNIPLNDKGKIADVSIPPTPSGGIFANRVFLFSSGFYISGYTNGKLWSFANASASLIENTVSGPVASPNDPNAQLYVLDRNDPPFGQSWIDWKDAVALGADFYDGDGDGVYNPVDKNGNGTWDPDEDHPDLVGDHSVWCVYNDGQPGAQRTRFPGVNPQGVEIRQTVFGFESKGALGNILFVRYRIKNAGTVADTLKDVLFGVWADPDLGDHMDDLVGVDVARNAGYVYNDGADDVYGANPPCFMIDFFSGPVVYIPGETFTDNNGNGSYDEGIDTPLDTAYSVRGQIMGIKEFPGAKNLGISSFVHYQQSDPTLGDPNTEIEARNYMLGLDKLGNPVTPCNWPLSQVRGGVDCNTIDNRYWYSGDPVTNTGWINTTPTDQRQMQNTGPFNLVKGEELEIIAAYIVGQGGNALESITEARRIDDGAQFIFDQNFAAPSPPPAVSPTVQTGEDFIDIIWDTHEQVNYRNTTVAWDLQFEGFQVYSYRTNSPLASINGIENQKVIASYDIKNFIDDVYKEDPQTGGITVLYPKSENQMDKAVYGDPATGRIRLRITEDPFTGGPLVKGKPYYFAITSYALNYRGLKYLSNPDTTLGLTGNYYLSKEALSAESENNPTSNIFTVVMGNDLYSPPQPLADANHIKGGSSGQLMVDPVVKEELTGDEYKVSFIIDSSTARYSTFYRLENTTTGQVLIDKSKQYIQDPANVAVDPTEGFILKLSPEDGDIGAPIYETTQEWINKTSPNGGVYYLSADLADHKKIATLSNLGSSASNFVRADKIRRVEIRFGEPGKAYRYLNGYIGSALTRRNSYVYAEAVTASDTAGLGAVGKLGEGFVDVPFQVWVQDFKTETGGFGETRQLAVGFIEKAANLGGNPDGQWDPGTSLSNSGEYILIFNSNYDPTGSQQVYKGYQDGATTLWADLRGYTIPAAASASSEERLIAKSPYFDVLYAFGIEKASADLTFSPGDKIIIPVDNYPYTPEDEFVFKTRANGSLTAEEQREIFEKVNVYPNPLYGFNPATSYTNSAPDEPFVTFSNLPDDVTIKIYSLSGSLLRTLTTADKSSPTSPFLRWDLQNESGLRVASGMYLAIVSSPLYGEKILKFAIIMPQKQIPKY